MHTTRPFKGFMVFLAPLLATAFIIGGAATAQADDAPNTSTEKEKELLAILRSDAPTAERAITCKLLAVYGSSAAVPDLASLLSDKQLASWARIALEAIPGPEADAALQDATESLQGRLLIGVINSIGVRRDANAVDSLAARLRDKDADVASAAAVALGRIGNGPATKTLRQSLASAPEKVRSAVAEGCVLCAERLVAEERMAEAAEIYDEVRAADVPEQRILEATRGAILARNEAGIPLLIEQFRSPVKSRFQLALTIAREFPGGEVDKALAAEMVRATPDRAALIVGAMADRTQTVVLPAVISAAEQGPKQVRLAALRALERVGNAASLPTLLKIALRDDVDLANTAKSTLAGLPGEQVDGKIKAMLVEAEGENVPLLIELVGQRRIDATPTLLKALDHSDKGVRAAALIALGETAAQKDLSVLVSRAVTPRHPEDAIVARRALKAASIRMPDREACAAELVAAMQRTSAVPTKTTLLEVLGAMGGTKALAAVGAAGRNADPQLQDISTRLLGVWMTADAAPVLLDLARTAPAEKYRTRALRGYIRIARQFVIPAPQRAEMCRKAFDAAQRPAEQKLVLDVLKRYPNSETLKVAIHAMQVPASKDNATEVALTIAQKLGGKGAAVRQLLSKAGLNKVKLEIVKAEYGSGSTQRDVTAILRKQAADSRLITLPSATYNASFGGDPLPGTTKLLKIQYRIDGKSGDASFAEGDLIILPLLN